MLHLFLNNTHVTQSNDRLLDNKLLPVYKALKPGPNPTISGKVKVTRPWNKTLLNHRLDIVIIGEIEKKAEKGVIEEFSKDVETFQVNMNNLFEDEYDFTITLSKDNQNTLTNMFKIRYYIKAELFEIKTDLWHIKTEKVIRSVKQDLIIERFYRGLQRLRIYEMDMGVAERLILKINLNKTHFFPDEIIVGKLTFLMTKFNFEKIEIYLKRIEMAGEENIEEETVCQQEIILDRNPEEGERIGFKFDLKKFNLIPTLVVQSLKGTKYSLDYQLFVALYDNYNTRLFKKFPIQIRQRENDL